MEDQLLRVQTIVKKLHMILREVRNHSKKSEQKNGLSNAKLKMLSEIASHQGIKVSQLATALFIHRSTCSNSLDKLEEKGLVKRDRRRSDQRSVHLYVTKKGSDFLQQTPRSEKGRLYEALHNLTPKQLTELEDSLENLLSSLNTDT